MTQDTPSSIKEQFSRRDKPHILLSFDLEMNQPSGRIIQLGAVAGNIITGEIFEEKFSVLVQCGEPLCVVNNVATNECDIPKLTGITQQRLDAEGVTLWQAYRCLVEFYEKTQAASTFLTWGYGDVTELRAQLVSSHPEHPFTDDERFPFGRRSLDVKSLHQAWACINGHSIKAGLSKALSKHKMTFDGRAHDAMWDAYNTFRLAHILFRTMKH